MAKLLYSTSAWWVFAAACDKNIALKLLYVAVFVYSYMAPLIQLLPNLQKMLMKLCLAGSDETDITFSTGFFLNLTAINIICALDGITFHYQLKQIIATFYN